MTERSCVLVCRERFARRVLDWWVFSPLNTTNQATSAVVGIEFWNSGQEFWGFGSGDTLGPMTIALGQNNYTIKLFPLTGSPESNTTLTSIEPGKDATLVAQVYDQNNQLVPNVGVMIEADVVMKSGGHEHHDGQRPKGKLNGQDPPIITGSTGASGFSFTFKAPAPAGDHILKATCTDRTCTQQGPDRVWVGVKGLLPLPADSTYALIPNQDVYHPDNHYLIYDAENRMLQLADLYRARFPNNPVLHLNDASLERGGIFDIYSNWVRPHAEHCMGTVIDIRANDAPGAVPDAIRNEFQRIAANIGVDAMWEIPVVKGKKMPGLRHYHVRLMGKEGLQCPW